MAISKLRSIRKALTGWSKDFASYVEWLREKPSQVQRSAKTESVPSSLNESQTETDVERYKLAVWCVSEDDIKVLREALFHVTQRGDISDEDRLRAHVLYGRLGELDAQ